MQLEIPKPRIKQRIRNPVLEQQGLEHGLHPVVARVLAARPLSTQRSPLEALMPKLKHLDTPFGMLGMDKAAERVSLAIQNKEIIGIETDHDCDGQTSHAVFYHNLIQHFKHPKELLRSYIGHRLTEGYGLSDPVVNRILADPIKPSLIITADNGSSDEPRIARLAAAGIDVIVTDHHEIPLEGPPKSAYICLNPTQTDCQYGDPYIAGCMVAWLLMAATRQKLIDAHYLPQNAPTLSDSLDFVAVGTMADCVSIARSINNRAVVNFGLKLIDKKVRPCWQALKHKLKINLVSEDLSFKIAPLLNSDGRLSSALGSVNFLLAETLEEAEIALKQLEEHNQSRKTIQKTIVSDGLKLANEQLKSRDYSICVYFPEGHAGVHGIVASRIKELYGRPTALFSPKEGHPELITGSLRGIDFFHVRDALQHIHNTHPKMFIAFGGHKGAGGATLKLKDFKKFSTAFEEAAKLQLATNNEAIGPTLWTDGMLSSVDLNLGLVKTLSMLEPFGREFEAPAFEWIGELQDLRWIGDGTHARVTLKDLKQNKSMAGVWFSARTESQPTIPVTVGSQVRVVFLPKANHFRGRVTFDLQVLHMENYF